MLSAITRVGTTVTATVASVASASMQVPVGRVTDVVWTWWADTVAEPVGQLKNNLVTPVAATSRIVCAVKAMSMNAAVATIEGGSGAQEPATAVGSCTRAKTTSPTKRSSWMCSRRSRGCGRRRTLHTLTVAPDAFSVEDTAPTGAGGHQPVEQAASGSGVPTPRLMVYIKRRPVMGTKWSNALTALGQDHVGVMVAPMDEALAKGGNVDVALPSRKTDHTGSGWSEAVSYDFGPTGYGTDFSIFKITDAEVRRDMFPQGDAAFVGTTSRTMAEIEAFNEQYAKRYHLGVSDCRDYTAELVRFTTGVRVAPGAIPHYVRTAQKHQAQLDDGTAGEAVVAAEAEQESGLVSFLFSVLSLVRSSATTKASSECPGGTFHMHRLISGAKAPFYVGLGL